MWGRKRARIADLVARNDLLVQQLGNAREERDSWEWSWRRADRASNGLETARRALRNALQTATADAAVARAEADALQRALLAEHGRAERYRAAWQSAVRGRSHLRARAGRYHGAWQSARRRASDIAYCDRLPFLPECQPDAAEPCDHGEGGCPVVVCHIGNRDELADLIRAAALEPAPFQTCRRCGAGYALGQPCSTCAYRERIAAELAASTPTTT